MDPIQELLTQFRGPIGFTMSIGVASLIFTQAMKDAVGRRWRLALSVVIGMLLAVPLNLSGWFNVCVGECPSMIVQVVSTASLSFMGTCVAFFTYKKLGMDPGETKE